MIRPAQRRSAKEDAPAGYPVGAYVDRGTPSGVRMA